MPFAAIENIYAGLTEEKQKEAYDFICFLASRKPVSTDRASSPKDSYSPGFFALFGSCRDESFVEPQDFAATVNEDELF